VASSEPGGPAKAEVVAAYGKLPLSFEANRGQVDSSVQFVSRGQGYTLFLTSREAVLSLGQAGAKRDVPFTRSGAQQPGPEGGARSVVRLQLVGGNRQPQVVQEDELPGKSSYFIGNDPAQWRTNIPHYGKVRYRSIYPGIDLVYYGNQRQLEHDFVVAPGADPGRIRFRLRGAQKLRLEAGDLVMRTGGGELRLQKPEIYQVLEGKRREVAGGYVLLGLNKVGFKLAAFDPDQPLVIDPTLVYSTYLGGNNNDYGQAIAVDSSGNAYVAGYTTSTNFPTTTAAYQTNRPTNYNVVFVTKLVANGQSLVYSTYLGGSVGQTANAIAVDLNGNAYVTGGTGSTDFPTTQGAFQTSKLSSSSNAAAFVTKLAANGQSLVYSTYLGGSGYDDGYGIVVDSSGNAYVTGFAKSTNFPITTNAFQTSLKGSENVFITKLAADGHSLVYSTYLGGNFADFPSSIAVDSSGNAYVTGAASSKNFPTTLGAFQASAPSGSLAQPAFVTKLAANGQSLVYSTFLGGTAGVAENTSGAGIAVDSNGNAYVTGCTEDLDFPTTTGAFQTTKQSSSNYCSAFVTKLTANGQSLVYSTYLGGSGATVPGDGGNGIAVDAGGNAYVTGSTTSTDFPTTTGAFQTTKQSSSADRSGFVTKLAASGQSLAYSTYLGGSGGGSLDTAGDWGVKIAIDSGGNAYVTGNTHSTNFPSTTGAFQTSLGGAQNAFVTKFNLSSAVATITTLTADVNPQYQGQSVTFTAYVAPTSGSAAPTGTVTSLDGSTQIGQVTLDGTGHAVLAIATLAVGSHSITANYSGDNSFSSSSGNLTEQILAPTYKLTVTDVGRGTGTVTSSPTGISCGSTCSASYNSGTSVTLTATPASGSTFAGWSGACSGTGACSVSMNANQNVTATFNCSICSPRVLTLPIRVTVATSATLGGTVNPSGAATTYWFEYSKRQGLAKFTKTQVGSLPAGLTESTVTVKVSGLMPHTVYDYRVAALNSVGTTRGQILEFHTGAQQKPSPAALRPAPLIR
jgi:hypothetical protein